LLDFGVNPADVLIEFERYAGENKATAKQVELDNPLHPLQERLRLIFLA
jgi:hypothetical protein